MHAAANINTYLNNMQHQLCRQQQCLWLQKPWHYADNYPPCPPFEFLAEPHPAYLPARPPAHGVLVPHRQYRSKSTLPWRSNIGVCPKKQHSEPLTLQPAGQEENRPQSPLFEDGVSANKMQRCSQPAACTSTHGSMLSTEMALGAALTQHMISTQTLKSNQDRKTQEMGTRKTVLQASTATAPTFLLSPADTPCILHVVPKEWTANALATLSLHAVLRLALGSIRPTPHTRHGRRAEHHSKHDAASQITHAAAVPDTRTTNH